MTLTAAETYESIPIKVEAMRVFVDIDAHGPSNSGHATIRVKSGNWLVRINGVLWALSDEEFRRSYRKREEEL